MSDRIKLNECWKKEILEEFSKPYFNQIKQRIEIDLKNGIHIYPPGQQIFAALDHTCPDDIKVVIVGQDPYHGVNQANGLAFSVNKNVSLPPSLRNIYKELENDLGVSMDYKNGDLIHWTHQGVLLLNCVLTVQANQAASHSGIGWEIFTDHIIQHIAGKHNGVVFILWGKYAQNKQHLISNEHNYIISSPHPSPLSAYQGFFGSKPFSKTNEILVKIGKQPIFWANKKPDV